MAPVAPKSVASLPLYTVVALCGFITEVLMRLLSNVAGEQLGMGTAVIMPWSLLQCYQYMFHNI